MPHRAMTALALIAIAGCGVTAKTQPNSGAKLYSPNNGPVCLLAGAPPTDVQFEVLGRVVATKRSYGSSDELFAPMVREAQKLGADALINLQAGQRFKGPLPWRITSPTGDGSAIKFTAESSRFDCAQAGGQLYTAGGGVVSPSAIASQQANASNPQQPPPIASQQDKYGDLERLKRLFDQGALTQEEFEREKAKVLN